MKDEPMNLLRAAPGSEAEDDSGVSDCPDNRSSIVRE